MKAPIVFFLALSCAAQTVTLSSGLKLSRKVYRYRARVCSADATTIDSGFVYQAAQKNGVDVIDVQDLPTVASRKNRVALAVTTLSYLSQLAAYLGSSGTFTASKKTISWILLGAGVLTETGTFIKGLPVDATANVMTGTLAIPAGGCVKGDVFASPPQKKQLLASPLSFKVN